MQLEQARSRVLPITPMVVLDDIKTALTRYEDLGFTPVPSGDGGCVGMAAGHTALILASAAFMRGGDYDALHVDPLVGQTIKYVHVTSVSQVAERLPATAHVLQDARTRGGTRELLVRDADDTLILAEVID
jgi:hypothetical protein